MPFAAAIVQSGAQREVLLSIGGALQAHHHGGGMVRISIRILNIRKN
jgi:hypothetical protein